ncbi:MAG: redoxin domain-containing protein [Chloroflexi bacterium]|nr:redoxin domain-containing protein [Chloroflexota bacterium]
MRDRYSEFTERGAKVIAIAPDTVDSARSFFERESLPFTCLPDPDREVFRMYDVKSAMISLGQRPGLFIVDKDGIVRYAHLGFQQWEIPSVDETLAELDALS